MFDPRSVRIRGPLSAHVEGLWAELLRQGYAATSARNLLRLTAHLGRWLEAKGLAVPDLTEDRAVAFARDRCEEGYTGFRTRRGLEPVLAYLRGVGAVRRPRPVVDDSPVGRFVRDYRTYLRRERGLAASTAHARTAFAKEFAISERPRLDWHQLTARDVTTYLQRRCRRASVPACKHTVTDLRSLLRFLYVYGRTPHDLTSAVPAVAGWRLSGLPQMLGAAQAKALLRSFDGSPLGLRDAAVVRLLLRLGLRAAEVAALDLDDIDWRLGQLTVHGKGQHEARLPLPQDVGRAVAAYLRRGRPPASTRSLFVRSRAPYTRIRPGAVSHLAQTALRRVGIAAGGSHLLRHTAATELLRAGGSLPEIAHVLRHRHIDTTAIYAKVDLRSLASIARPWPEVVP
ncbi:MAG TPA: tyrosine-type recombinase/integrase [Anaeromyxobacter sp.]|nr:tyrosine-type recombinase/integrase [Anaeromyxobacter sp.]